MNACRESQCRLWATASRNGHGSHCDNNLNWWHRLATLPTNLWTAHGNAPIFESKLANTSRCTPLVLVSFQFGSTLLHQEAMHRVNTASATATSDRESNGLISWRSHYKLCASSPRHMPPTPSWAVTVFSEQAGGNTSVSNNATAEPNLPRCCCRNLCNSQLQDLGADFTTNWRHQRVGG